MIFTSDQNIEHLQKLVTNLSKVTFHITVRSFMGQRLLKMLKYCNVRLNPTNNATILDMLKGILIAYLVINYGAKGQEIIKDVEEMHIPILFFRQVANNINSFNKYEIFGDDDVQGMVSRMKSFIGNE